MLSAERIATPEEVLEAVGFAMKSGMQHDGSNRRISERIHTFLPIEFAVVDENQQLVGEIHSAVTRDISVGGLGIISVQEIDAKQIVARIKQPGSNDVSLLLNVHYCNSIGPLFFVGASFCADWSGVG